ncbi:MAG: hypothetical protein GF384_06055, partial [Elusimicrobia bacterium]|nr:hypothetical protein [Elusimicrobiota bacterium]
MKTKRMNVTKKAGLRSLLKAIPGTPILVVGDLMADKFLWGDVSRISPEAPVPVLELMRETWAPGGSGNVVNNLTALGARVFAIGVVGADKDGETIVSSFDHAGVNTEGIIVDDERPTITKTRIIARNQQVLRLDVERTNSFNRHMHSTLRNAIQRITPQCAAVIISDYGKGIITRDLLKYIIGQARKKGIPVTVDPKIEHFQQYRGVTCITPNLHEARAGMHRFRVDSDADLEKLGCDILKRLRCDSVLITRGEMGMD